MGGIRRMDGGWAVRVASLASVVAHQAMAPGYASPQLTLAYPAPGVSLPGENATIVFQYASSGDDVLDLRSFRVIVDDVDRTSLFRVTADAAWGPIVAGGAVGISAHDVHARVCSVRGVCVDIQAVVTVVGAPKLPHSSSDRARRRKIVDVLLEMARRLLKP